MIRAILLLLLLSGCESVTPTWEMFGVTSTATHNKHIEEMEAYSKEVIDNQALIVDVTGELVNENITEAKANDDAAKLERSVGTRGKIRQAREASQALSSREFSKAPEPSFNFDVIINTVMTIVMTALTGGVISQRGKIARVVGKAHALAKSTNVDNLDNDPDFKRKA